MKTKHTIGLLFLIAALFIVGCTTTGVETPPGSGSYETNTVPHPKVLAAIEAVRAANAGSAPVNPYAPLIDAAAVSAIGLLGAFATWANNRRKSSEAALTTVIAGVEQGGDPNTKKAIYTIATSNGTQPLIESKVNPSA